MIEVLNSQHVRTLRAKGLGPFAILWNTGCAMSASFSPDLARPPGQPPVFRRGGAIQAVFAIPGAGSLVAYSAINKDFPVVQGVVLVLVIMVIVVNLAVDILNALLDPRASEA